MIPPSTWPCAATGLMMVPESWAAETSRTNHAGLAIEANVNGMAGELGPRPAGETLVADTHRRHGRIFRRCAGTFPDQHLAFGGDTGQLDDRDGLVGRTGDLPSEASTMSSRAASSWSAARSRSCAATSRAPSTTARLLSRVCEPVAPVSYSRRRVLIDELEILGLHPQLLRRQHPESHDRTGTALLGASDDHPGAVAVDLDVRTGRTGEARPPRDRRPTASSSGRSSP